ncbi:hypothetical protein HaLaN_20708 [Haematococcus lacustris]|uniref:Uncharacterized protein n=1 Tax=Haematococcus lacustris TaxID=44745 RepID=A0A6A0A1W4_HAELA|nr:hypothetical protein HaLaN_20708 [Haematococcus lacustris]
MIGLLPLSLLAG